MSVFRFELGERNEKDEGKIVRHQEEFSTVTIPMASGNSTKMAVTESCGMNTTNRIARYCGTSAYFHEINVTGFSMKGSPGRYKKLKRFLYKI
jgi:hypothetical protein